MSKIARTAEEIVDSFLPKNMGARDCVIAAINSARKEAIEAAAERAVVFMPSHPHLHGTKNIDKESILSLIKELK